MVIQIIMKSAYNTVFGPMTVSTATLTARLSSKTVHHIFCYKTLHLDDENPVHLLIKAHTT